MNIKIYCLLIWSIIDWVYFNFTRLQYVKKSCGEKTILRVRVIKYKGRNVILSDGTEINKNDTLIKIHLHNAKLLSLFNELSEIKRGLAVYKSIKESLPFVYHYLNTHKQESKIKGLIGITLLHKGSKKLGFEPVTIHSHYFRSFKRVALFPIYFLASSNAMNKRVPEPMYLFMSKESLKRIYHLS